MSGSLPSLSIILPNYNHAHYIGQALEAILSQSVRPLEVIVVDDASTDNSASVVEEFARRDPLVRLIRNATNIGPHPAINRGLIVASGDYVYETSSDDWMLPGFIEKSLTALAQHPDAGLVWSDNMTLDVETGLFNPNRLRLSDRPCYFPPATIAEGLRRGYIPGLLSAHSSVMKRSALVEVGGLVPELKWHADGFVMLVIALRYGACYVPEALTCARIVSDSYMLSGTRHTRERRCVLERMLQLHKLPEYRDVLVGVQRSGAYGFYHMPMLAVILSHPEHWDYLSPALLRRVFWFASKAAVSRIASPAMRRAYYRVRDWYRGSVRGGLE